MAAAAAAAAAGPLPQQPVMAAPASPAPQPPAQIPAAARQEKAPPPPASARRESAPRRHELTEAPPPPASARRESAPRRHESTEVFEVHLMWCHLLDRPEEAFPLQQVVQLLQQGGEIFRSFVQFLARATEPHRSGGAAGGASIEAVRRSCVVMQVACNVLGNPRSGPVLESAGAAGFACCELLGGLQPGSLGNSLHICTVLQHLLSTHEEEVCDVLLQNHALFLLLRALDRPGCQELLLSLLLGCDPLLPALVPDRPLKRLGARPLKQVLQYVRSTCWPRLLAALLDQGASRLGADLRPATVGSGTRAGASCSSSAAGPKGIGSPNSSSACRRAQNLAPPESPARQTPTRRTAWCSPPTAAGWRSPEPFGLLTPPPSTTPASTPQRRYMAYKLEESPLCTLLVQPSSPSPSLDPSLLLEVPSFPGVVTVAASSVPALDGGCCPCGGIGIGIAVPIVGALDQDGAALPLAADRGSPLAATGAGAEASVPRGAPGRATGAREGVCVLVEFLACVLEACGRAADAARKSRSQQQQQQQQPQQPQAPGAQPGAAQPAAAAAQDEGLELSGEVRVQLLQTVFVETALISNLFRLLQQSASQFEAATLLHALLNYARNHQRCQGLPVEALLLQYTPHIDTLSNLVLSGSNGSAASQQPTRQRGACRELRLSSYVVREPLGALRVLAVQILAALAELEPQRTLAAIRQPVWSSLARWFLEYRCNHIFQASCGKLLIALIHHGSPSLQHHVLVRSRLLQGICEAVLDEGLCGDRWHDLRPVRDGAAASGPAEPRSSAPVGAGLGGGSGGGCGGAAGGGGGLRRENLQEAVQRSRHPGGLGGIVPVVAALREKAAGHPVAGAAGAKCAADGAAVPPSTRAGRGLEASPACSVPTPCRRRPPPEAAASSGASAGGARGGGPALARILAVAPLWPHVLGALALPTAEEEDVLVIPLLLQEKKVEESALKKQLHNNILKLGSRVLAPSKINVRLHDGVGEAELRGPRSLISQLRALPATSLLSTAAAGHRPVEP